MAQGGVGEGGGEVVLVLRVAVDGDAGLVFGAFVAVAVVGIVVFPLQLEGEQGGEGLRPAGLEEEVLVGESFVRLGVVEDDASGQAAAGAVVIGLGVPAAAVGEEVEEVCLALVGEDVGVMALFDGGVLAVFEAEGVGAVGAEEAGVEG